MQLQALRPKQGADLLQLRHLLDGRGWRSALPDSFPDAILLRLARDFRCVEASFTTDVEQDELPSLAPAMYVLMNLLMQHPARGGASDSLELSEEGMVKGLQLYQWSLEREIVRRITGLSVADQTASLMEGLLRCVHD